MSLATIDRPTTSFSATSARSLVATNRQPQAASPETDAQTDAAQPRLRAVPAGTEARGFVLYVGLDELKAELAGTDLGQIVAQLKSLVAELVPTAETHAAVALAPQGAGGNGAQAGLGGVFVDVGCRGLDLRLAVRRDERTNGRSGKRGGRTVNSCERHESKDP